ncbi:MAG TPA: hypothetical protein VFA09_25050, partial [Ktedonobacteraceae bacterium]|nr:hypothetical protein [Ktedonobacteraceae bacterium]
MCSSTHSHYPFLQSEHDVDTVSGTGGWVISTRWNVPMERGGGSESPIDEAVPLPTGKGWRPDEQR